MMNKENEEIKKKCQEYKMQFEYKIKDKIEKDKIKKSKSNNKINVIKDLQKKIQEYKTERTKRYSNYKQNEDDDLNL